METEQKFATSPEGNRYPLPGPDNYRAEFERFDQLAAQDRNMRTRQRKVLL